MPSRNVVKQFAAHNYYHVYNRGVEKRQIFMDNQDYVVYLGILKKYLSPKSKALAGNNRHAYQRIAEVELLAYCLMPNHVHLLFYQSSVDGITRLMRRVMTSYAMYFNRRYNRVGGLFQGRYRASLIDTDNYLIHISRYIHLNPESYLTWPYSSWPYYCGKKHAMWLNTSRIMALFDTESGQYKKFLDEYLPTKKALSGLKSQLANGDEL